MASATSTSQVPGLVFIHRTFTPYGEALLTESKEGERGSRASLRERPDGQLVLEVSEPAPDRHPPAPPSPWSTTPATALPAP
jgi:hypothetical protein